MERQASRSDVLSAPSEEQLLAADSADARRLLTPYRESRPSTGPLLASRYACRQAWPAGGPSAGHCSSSTLERMPYLDPIRQQLIHQTSYLHPNFKPHLMGPSHSHRPPANPAVCPAGKAETPTKLASGGGSAAARPWMHRIQGKPKARQTASTDYYGTPETQSAKSA